MNDHLLPLKGRLQIAEKTMAFWLDTSHAGFSFRAGQHADFTLLRPPKTDEKGDTRTFSLASSPRSKESLMIATRMRGSAFKNNLATIPLGTKIKVSHPMGSFALHKDQTKPAVFLAGGIGITPMRSIIEWAVAEKLPHQMYLFYSNRSRATTAFLDEFEQWAKENKNFVFVPTITGDPDPHWPHEVGVITKEMIAKYVPNLLHAYYYIAGPPSMVANMWQMLIISGVSEENIKTEEFAGY